MLFIVKFPEVFSAHSAFAPAFPAKNIPAIDKTGKQCSFYSSPFMTVPVISFISLIRNREPPSSVGDPDPGGQRYRSGSWPFSQKGVKWTEIMLAK